MATHTLAELEAAIIAKGRKIDVVTDDHHDKKGTLKSINILSSYKDSFGRLQFHKWDIEGKCTSRNGKIAYPELNLF